MKQRNLFRSLFLLAVLLLCGMKASAQEPYAVLSEDNKTLTFYYDDQKESSNGMDVGPFDLDDDGKANSGWYSKSKNIMNVVFDDSFANCTSITSTRLWFTNCTGLTSITGINNLKTDNVTNMDYMFYGCVKLTSLDVSNFNTMKVTSMFAMFGYCSLLTSLDLSNFDTSNVNDMGYMFYACSNLTILDLRNFNTSNVESMNQMFNGCKSLTSINLSSFDTKKVVNMLGLFNSCLNLASLDISSFNTSNVENMAYMFSKCSSLTTIYASEGWSTEKVTEGSNMFIECKKLIGNAGTVYSPDHTDHTYAHFDYGTDNPGYLTPYNSCGVNVLYKYEESTKTLTIYGTGDMKDYNTYSLKCPWDDYKNDIQVIRIEDGVTSIGSSAFYDCSSLTSIDIPNSVTAIGSSAFAGCTALTSIKISCDIGDRTFYRCIGIKSVSINEGVEIIGIEAFAGCSALESISLPSTLTTIGHEAFRNCPNLTTISVDGNNKTFDSRDNCNAVIKTADNELILGCKATIIPKTVTSLGEASYMGSAIETFTVPENITTIGRTVFYDCPNLKTLVFGNGVTSIAGEAIKKCPLLETIKIGSGLKSIDDENIVRCEGLKDIYIFANTIPQRTNQNYDKIYLFDKTPISTATLHVPASLVDSYKATAPWSGFGNVVPLTEDDSLSGVSVVNSDTSFNTATPVYNLSGQRLTVPQKGINIVNGKKVVVK